MGVGNVNASVEALRQRLAPAIAALGLDLYDIELTGGGGGRTLRVTVTGVDLDAITAVTQAISPLLDDAPELPGSVLLEVSSPGVERVLRTPEHYAGALGTTVAVKLRTAEGTRRVHGVVTDAGTEEFTLEADGGRERIAYTDVTQARTVFEWGPQPRPGPRRGRPKENAKATTSKGVNA